ncbi:MAG: GIY-YIG nuclease family protein, partial [Lachnospiraceae bacterium]|nr:GIY-YIG nuclease family protein [Lachnospiraceae bacterium]
MNYVYLLKCADGTLYCGWTTDLEKRLGAHNAGTGAKYTRSRRPVEIVYHEAFEEKTDALRREWSIKRMNRKQKLGLIEKDGNGGQKEDGLSGRGGDGNVL